MNYFDLPEFASVAPFASVTDAQPSAASSSLGRLVASFHRRAVAPRGYRYVANLDAADLARALIAIRYASGSGELRLMTPAVDNDGNSVSDIALYVRDSLPDPTAFWLLFHSADHSHAA